MGSFPSSDGSHFLGVSTPILLLEMFKKTQKYTIMCLTWVKQREIHICIEGIKSSQSREGKWPNDSHASGRWSPQHHFDSIEICLWVKHDVAHFYASVQWAWEFVPEPSFWSLINSEFSITAMLNKMCPEYTVSCLCKVIVNYVSVIIGMFYTWESLVAQMEELVCQSWASHSCCRLSQLSQTHTVFRRATKPKTVGRLSTLLSLFHFNLCLYVPLSSPVLV